MSPQTPTEQPETAPEADQNILKVFDHKSFLANLSSRPGVYRMVD